MSDRADKSVYSAENLTVITLPDAIRKRPGMYVGSVNELGVSHIICELIANGIDQFLIGNATTVSVDFDGNTIHVADDGEGLPPLTDGGGSVEKWFLEWHDTPTAKGHAPHIHLQSVGCGLCVAAALSKQLVVDTVRDGRRTHLRFEQGRLVKKEVTGDTDLARGTRFALEVDQEIMNAPLPNTSALRGKVFQAAHLFPGIEIRFCGERFHSPNGLGDLIHLICHPTAHESLNRPVSFHFNERVGDVQVSASALGDARGSLTTFISWANGVPTASHGDHVSGFHDVLLDLGWSPAVAMIHAVMHQPQYAGPVRDRLIVPEVRGVIRDALRNQLASYLDKYPSRYL